MVNHPGQTEIPQFHLPLVNQNICRFNVSMQNIFGFHQSAGRDELFGEGYNLWDIARKTIF